MNENSKFWLLIFVLLFGGALVNFFELRGEKRVERQNLQTFPATVGVWQAFGKDTRFDAETEKVLRADDYLLRDYFSKENRAAANLYVGFYGSQKNGATYHSPLNCLPGAGWEFVENTRREIALPSGETFTAQAALVRSAELRGAMIYWYQGRGRRTADEYSDKILTVWDGVTKNRSDGALVRVFVVSGETSDANAEKVAADFAGQAARELEKFVP